MTDCIASQVALHRLYGGVVPELASRKHIEAIYALADEALARASMTRQEIADYLGMSQNEVCNYARTGIRRKRADVFIEREAIANGKV